MDDAIRAFVDGVGVAAATSGVLTQAQGQIFGLLYLSPEPLSLDQIASELGQSKGNVSVGIRALVDWQLARRVVVAGSRRDHYEAATDLWKALQEIVERRFRWNLRQVISAVEEARSEMGRATRDTGDPESDGAGRFRERFVRTRLDSIGAFASAIEAGMGRFASGQVWAPDAVRRLAAGGAAEHRSGK